MSRQRLKMAKMITEQIPTMRSNTSLGGGVGNEGKKCVNVFSSGIDRQSYGRNTCSTQHMQLRSNSSLIFEAVKRQIGNHSSQSGLKQHPS